MGQRSAQPRNIVEILGGHASAHPERVAIEFLEDGENVSTVLTYGELHRRASAVAVELSERCGPGGRALLLYPSGVDYVTALLGCFYAGIVAVPAYPPESMQPKHLRRVLSILEDAAPELVLTHSAFLPSFEARRGSVPALARTALVATDRFALDDATAAQWRAPAFTEESVAFLQYTSGSTSAPKGVMVGHDNLVANEALLQAGLESTEQDVFLSWLPLFHDMGLIGGLLHPLYVGMKAVLMAPQHFIERPERWLRAIDARRATISGGPDFAYRLCAERIRGELEGLDLGSWRLAFSGAEPVRSDTLEAFSARFAGASFDPSAFYPCYGLAEATLFVTGGRAGGGASTQELDPGELARGRGTPSAGGLALVGCGWARPEAGLELVVADPESGTALEDGLVGEILVAGASVARGYYRNPEATARAFVRRGDRTYLRTGDLGFVRGGQLYVTGRASDTIIVHGQNLYPQDIERTVEGELEVFRKGRIIAFPVQDARGEGIGVAAEVRERMANLLSPEAVSRAVAQAIAEAHGHPLRGLALLPPGKLPTTSSGKLQRRECRAQWERGELDAWVVLRDGRVEGGAGAAAGNAPPASPTEIELAAIWRAILGVVEVRRDDVFFTLGGSSVHAAGILGRVVEVFGVRLDVRAIFEAPTLASLAAAVDEARARGEVAAKDAVPPAEDAAAFRQASFGEQRWWFLDRLDPEGTAYQLSERLRLSGPLNRETLIRAFGHLVARHEALRTTYREVDGRALRVVSPPAPIAIPFVELGALPREVALREASDVARREANARFDLEHGPLFRARCVVLGPDEAWLLLSTHHVVSDAWSLGVLVRELVALYEAPEASWGALLPPLPVRYGDYAAWQRRWADGEEAAKSLAHFRAALGAEHPVLELPSDRPRPPGQSHRAGTHRFTLDAALTRRVRAFAAAKRASTFMVLAAAFQALLHRFTGQRDVRLGVPFANRSRDEVRSLIGFFVNTQVLRTEFDGALTADALVAHVREAALLAAPHQDLPFERLVDALNPERRLGQNPLFQVLFNHLTEDFVRAPRSEALRVERLDRIVARTQFDLALDTLEGETDILGEVTYSADMFDASTIARMATGLRLLLEGMLASPSARVVDLPIVPAEERARVLEAWNDTGRDYDVSLRVHEIIEATARRSPDAPALVFRDVRWSYAELEARATALAARLRGWGVGPEVLVGVHAARSLEMVVALYAVLKAGGAYVPLDPEYPIGRVREVLRESGLGLVLSLSQSERAAELAEAGVEVWALDAEAPPAPPSGEEPPRGARPSPDALAYCIFTSGSTGRPKGVACTHGGLLNRLTWMQDAYALTAADRVLQKTPFTFDVSVWEFFWPLMVGATLVVAEPGAHKDVARLGEAIAREGVTTLHFVPSMLEAFVASGELARCGAVRQVFASGEALPTDLAARFLRAHPARLHNLYGPTEASIDVTAWACSADDARTPIGRPIANTALYVLDERLAPVPVGVAGDLYIAGVGLARGYLAAPHLTAERFVPDPFTRGASGARMYRSGDRARHLADGAIEYLGRADGQVKLRGFRVELGEIEARLRALPGVAAAAVVVREDAPGEKRLVAYVVPSGAVPSPEDAEAHARLRDGWRLALSASLPDWMIPQLWVKLEALPLSPSGKLDRRALPAPDRDRLRKAYVAPVSPAERALAGVWCDLLRVPEVGRDDHFFELGGDSIIALQVVARVKKAGFVVALEHVFQHQTLRALASAASPVNDDPSEAERPAAPAAVGLEALSDAERAALPVPLADVEDVFPLSPMQEGILLHSLLDAGSGIYVMQDHYRLNSAIDARAFVGAWDAVVRRHPVLRASFWWRREGKALQIVHREVEGAAAYLDLGHLDEEAQRRAIADAMLEERTSGMDLSRAPLMRVRLFRLGDGRFSFVQSYHHILIDDWCRSLMLVDFFEAYRALRDGRGVPERPAPTPYRTFIAWLASQDTERARAYFRAELGDVRAATSLGVELPRAEGPSRMVDRDVRLDGRETTALRRSARQKRVTINSFAQAAWAWVLSQLSGSRDVLFGVTVAGRPAELEGVEDTVGLFINTVPLRVRLPDPARGEGTTIADWASALLAQNVALRRYEHLPLPAVQACSGVPAGERLFHSLFVFENAPLDRALDELGAELEFGFSENRTHTNYPLTVVVVPGESFRLQISYDQRFFEGEAVLGMLEAFKRALLFMAEHPDASLSDVPRWSDREGALLASWNDTEVAHPFERGFVGLFEEQVDRGPDRVAASYGGDHVTYRELAARARRVGAALIAEGVQGGAVVALIAPRGIPLLGAIVGTFHAGAAYLGVDPGQPIKRWSQVLELARPACVVTTRALAGDVASALAETSAGGRTPVLVLEDVELAETSASFAPRASHPGQLAYCIFTSGSTGTPKGAMVTLAGMLNNQLSKIPYLGLTERDVIAQTASLTFDVSVWQLLTALLCGARVVIVPDRIAQDAEALLACVEREGITVLESVPSLMKVMLELPEGRAPLSTLRWMLPTGEALAPELARAWFARYPRVPLVNAYGPAECADDVSLHRMTEAPSAEVRRLPIGAPTDNNRLHLVDAALERVGLGVPGEIVVAGVGVGLGYLGDPARTAEAFVPDPFAATPGARLYRTGDRGARGEDGTITYLGRVDHQVKIRGQRVELGEIEARLSERPEIAGAVVATHAFAPGDERLVAYVVPRPEAAFDGSEAAEARLVDALRGHLKASLPDVMVPSHFMTLAALPLSANGKIDRRGLPAPVGRRAAKASAPPEPGIEAQLAAIWCAVLRVDAVGRDDSFFELGGHSLLLTRVWAQVTRAFGVELPMRAFFEAPTLRALAARVRALSAEGRGVTRPPLVPARRPPRVPVALAQRRLYFLWEVDPEGAVFTLAEACRWRGALDRAALEAAFASLVSRHETLRTVFAMSEGDDEPCQIVLESARVPFTYEDARAVRGELRDEALAAVAREEGARPFDLRRGPLLRARVLDFDEDDHALVVAVHHIVADGWSMPLMLAEIAELYAARRERRAPALPELPVQYADYAAWQRRFFDEAEAERQLRYWTERLGTEHPVLALPTDRPRPRARTERGKVHRFAVPPELLGRMRRLALAHDATLFAVSLAGFMVLLAKSSGEADVRVGVPVATRSAPEVQSLVGFFVNTQVFRLNVDGAATFGALVSEVREALLGAEAHQELPFERLASALNPERTLAHAPLFQVLYNHVTPEHPSVLRLPGAELRFIEREVLTTEFDLTVHAVEEAPGDGEGALTFSVTYSLDLFEEATVARMGRHWLRVLEAAVDPRAPRIDAWDLRSPDEMDAAERFAGERFAEAWPGLGVHDAFERQAAATPTAVAVTFGEESSTYAELDARSNQLARHLRALGVGPETLVGVHAERSVALVVTLLAVLKAGGAYVPLEPELPPLRLAEMVREADLKLVVTQEHLRAALPDTGASVFAVDGGWGEVATLDPSRLPRAWSGDAMAYCIYTSGSTGAPKGVINTHAGLKNRIAWMQAEYALDAGDVVLQKTPFGFDVSVWEFFWPLTVGARLVVAAPGAHKDPTELGAVIRREGVTTMHFVPSMLDAFVASGELERCPSLRRVMSSGEALSRENVEAFHARSRAALHNLYGPTEASIDVTAWPCARGELGGDVPIGRPIWNTELHVLGAGFAPAPRRIAGELFIGGVGLARGYVRRPDLTADRFVPDPGGDGARMYRTGDLGRRREDGALEYLGRVDHQVKIRGVRIELGEIEGALRRMDLVRAAAVLVRSDRGSPRLVAYVVPAGATSGDPTEPLRRRLLQVLPEAMVPHDYVPLGALPMTASGKLDRKALQAMRPPTRARHSEPIQAPTSAVEASLVAVWRTVLRAESIGTRDNFFELGGDSILALQVVAKARAAGIGLRPRDLMQHQTIEALAQNAARPVELLAEQGRVEGDVPLTPIQAWFFEQAFVDAHHWNQSVVLRVAGDVDAGALERAFAAVVEHHDALRLRFWRDGGAEPAWRQAHREDVPPGSFTTVNVGRSPKFATVVLELGNAAHRSLDLEDGRVIRAVHARAEDGGAGRLILVAHHLVVDAVSWRILLEDLRDAYGQASAGALRIALPPKSASYKAFSHALVALADAAETERQLAHWSEIVARASTLPRGDAPRRAEEDTLAAARTYEVTLPEATTEKLLGKAHLAYRTQVNDLLLAALARAWSEVRGETSLLVELEGHGREPAPEGLDVTRTVGWFTVQYPVRLELLHEGDLGASLLAIKEQLRKVPSGGEGFGLLRYLATGPREARALGRRYAARGGPRVSFNYLGQIDRGERGQDEVFSLADEGSGDECSPLGHRPDELEILAVVRGGRLRVAFRTSPSLAETWKVQDLAAAYASALGRWVEHCMAEERAVVLSTDFSHVDLAQDELDDLLEELS